MYLTTYMYMQDATLYWSMYDLWGGFFFGILESLTIKGLIYNY